MTTADSTKGTAGKAVLTIVFLSVWALGNLSLHGYLVATYWNGFAPFIAASLPRVSWTQAVAFGVLVGVARVIYFGLPKPSEKTTAEQGFEAIILFIILMLMYYPFMWLVSP